MVARHDKRHYDTRRSHRWTIRVGTRVGRLLYLKWIGTWRQCGWWLVRCDCGTEKILPFRPADYISCGCRQREVRQKRDFRVQLLDGTWGHNSAHKVTLLDGRIFPSVTASAATSGSRDAPCSTASTTGRRSAGSSPASRGAPARSATASASCARSPKAGGRAGASRGPPLT